MRKHLTNQGFEGLSTKTSDLLKSQGLERQGKTEELWQTGETKVM